MIEHQLLNDGMLLSGASDWLCMVYTSAGSFDRRDLGTGESSRGRGKTVRPPTPLWPKKLGKLHATDRTRHDSTTAPADHIPPLYDGGEFDDQLTISFPPGYLVLRSKA